MYKAEVYDEQHRHDQSSVPRLNLNSLCQQYGQSQRRLFILDLEGTLIPYGPMKDAIPMNPQVSYILNYGDESTLSANPSRQKRVLRALTDLVQDSRNNVFDRHASKKLNVCGSNCII